ncbi:tetratricopeptide repeat protein [Pelagibacterium montanilacus]|uniref:tetratricopeptide repeat protein n=1 Tax=Pelagibacterium montanilacus TaxID=2185280 RepID=UPI000F8E05BE|nr:tetratricopeptide repeat protein [Pelagibacterium montanilacus]
MSNGDALDGAEQAAVRQSLEAILAWPALRRSPNLSAFLRYVVEARLRGETDAIKAYAIAVDVFDRPAAFDPQADPIVRVQARRLRGLLETYYAATPDAPSPRIALPVGSYVPEFVWSGETLPQPDASAGGGVEEDEVEPIDETVGEEKALVSLVPAARGERWASRLMVAVGVLGLAVVVLALVVGTGFWDGDQQGGQAPASAQPQRPLVIVADFDNLTDDERGVALAAGLGLEIVTDLAGFPDVDARYRGTLEGAQAGAEAGQPVFALSGVVRRGAGAVQYSAVLTDSRTDAIVGSYAIDAPVESGRPELSVSEVSERLVMQIASPRGALHAEARAWLDQRRDTREPLEAHPCIVQYKLFLDRASTRDRASARACARSHSEGVDSPGPAQAPFLAIRSAMMASDAWRSGMDSVLARDLMAQASMLGAAAVEAAPLEAFVWAQKARASLAEGQLRHAREEMASALQLNPASLDAIVQLAEIEARMGNWRSALDRMAIVEQIEPDPPPRYALVPALHALRGGEYGLARAHGERLYEAEPELATAILVAVGGLTRDTDLINSYLPRLLATSQLAGPGILPALRRQISDPEMLRILANGLTASGLTLDRLLRPWQ